MKMNKIIFTFAILIYQICHGNGQFAGETVSEETLDMPALGRIAELGELYDARTDKFLTMNIFSLTKVPKDNILTTQSNFNSLTSTETYSYEERLKKLDISPEVKLNILGGLSQITGSESCGHFLRNTQISAKIEKASIIQRLRTVQEHFNVNDQQLKPSINFDVLTDPDVTHVVVGVEWGGDIYVTVESPRPINEDGQKAEPKLLEKIQLGLSLVSDQGNINISKTVLEELNKLKIELYSDIMPDKLPETFLDVLELMTVSTSLIKSSNNGKGKPMKYTLIPIQTLQKLWKLNTTKTVLNKINEILVNDFVRMLDAFSLTNQKVNDLVDEVKQFDKFIPKHRVDKIVNMQNEFQNFQTKMSETFAQTIVDIRSGKTIPDILKDNIKTAMDKYDDVEENELTDFEDLLEEVTFIKQLKMLQASFMGKHDSLKIMMMENHQVDFYVLYYNSIFTNKDQIVIDDFRNMLKNRTFYGASSKFLAINYELSNHYNSSAPIEHAKISKYRDEVLIKDKFEPAKIKTFEWMTITTFDNFEFDHSITGFFNAFQQTNGYKSSYLINYHRAVFSEDFKLVGQGTFVTTYMYLSTNYQAKNINLASNAAQTVTANGKSYSVQRYEILTNPGKLDYKWVESTNGLPPMAVQCGIELGQVSYCGRRKINNVIYVPVRIINGIAYAFDVITSNSYTGREFEYLVYV